MMKLRFFLQEIEDVYIRDNFKRLQDALNAEPLLKTGFKFYEITVTAAATNREFKHNLTFIPKDVILTSVSNGESVTFTYSSFDVDNIVFTVTGACTFRAFIGTYPGGA
jgi:hypothetical protein